MIKSKRVKERIASCGKHLFMILLSAYMLIPLIWAFLTSVKSRNDIFDYPPKIIDDYTMENYVYVFEIMKLGRGFLITAGLTIASLMIAVACSVLAAYVMSRYDFKGKKIVQGLIVFPMLIPGFTNMIPLYKVFSTLGLVDNFWGLVLLYIPGILPMGVMVLQSYLISIPATLEEAAMIDGCNRLQLLTRIVFPIIRPGVVAITMTGVVTVWNEFMTTLIFTSGGELRTLTITLYLMAGAGTGYDIHYGNICATGIVSVLPVLILFMIFRKQFIGSLMTGAIKG